jgi:glutathione synthase/RimK-type ligase-like ATP-grasp enzyme
MRIAIHHRKGSFSDRWIEYCNQKNIPFKIVNCYSNDIVSQLVDCDSLMWHFHHANYTDTLFAKQLLFSIEQAGKKTFPNFNTAWHFDDKLGQKYLLEMVGASFVPSYIFYNRRDAEAWVAGTSFPKVFKLRGGASSENVKLIKHKKKAKAFIKKAFSSGFSQFNRVGYLKERIRKFLLGKDSILGLLKGLIRIFIPTEFSKLKGTEKGYIYFQNFLPGNTYDTRIIVIGNKAFGLIRRVRENDFRASGSGFIEYSEENIDKTMLIMAFKYAKILNTQVIAFDFLKDRNDNPVIVEISYGFSKKAYDNCPGYWDEELNWYPGSFNPYGWMIELLIQTPNK